MEDHFKCIGISKIQALVIVLFLSAGLVCITIMALNAPFNSHPDEQHHYKASKYYMQNWRPPKYNDPAIKNTYSVYGISRLNNPGR